MAVNLCNWGLESSCSLFADIQRKTWHLWNYFLISSNITKLAVMSFILADPKRAAGDGLRFVPHSRNDANTLHRRKMIFPVITHWQMPCLVFFMITTVREKLANPWSNTCQNTLQSWHKLDLVPSSSTMDYCKGFKRHSGFSLPPFLIVTHENSLKTPSVLTSIYKPAKGAPNCCLVALST